MENPTKAFATMLMDTRVKDAINTTRAQCSSNSATTKSENTITPDFVDSSIKKTMRLVSDVYDTSRALDRNSELTNELIEAQKLSVSSEQRKALVDIDELREKLHKARLANIRYGVAIKMLSAMCILLGLYFFFLKAVPQWTANNYVLHVAVFMITCVLFAWYMNKYIKNLA